MVSESQGLTFCHYDNNDNSTTPFFGWLFCMKTMIVLLESKDKVFLFALLALMKRSLNRSIGYFEETVPAYFSDEFAIHFRLSCNTCELLMTEIVASGHINLGNEFGRAPIPPQKQVIAYLWMMAYACETTLHDQYQKNT